MKVDFAHYRLDAVIADAARSAFAAAIAENPDHRFFAFALTTLSEVQYIECSLNSNRNLEAILSRAGRTDDQAYYKWFSNEWGEFEYFGQETRDFFSPVQALLTRIESETIAADPSFESRRRYVFDMMIAALKMLDEMGCFGEGEERSNRIAFADVYDDESSEELRTLSANMVNAGKASPALIDEFHRAGQA